MKPNWNISYIKPEGSRKALISVCSFQNGNAHIVVHKGCWAVVSRGVILDRVFGAAMAVLRQLPDSPEEYRPLSEFLDGRKLAPVPGGQGFSKATSRRKKCSSSTRSASRS